MANFNQGDGSPEFLAERNNPYQAQRCAIAFILVDTLFIVIFYMSRYYNVKAVSTPMLVCNTCAYIMCMGTMATGILMTQIGGAGHHAVSVPITTVQTWLKLSKVLEYTYTPAVMFSKLAALFLYYQVFEVTVFRRCIYALGVIIILQGVASFILAFSICRPFRYFWTQVVDVNDGSCGDVMMFYRVYSVPSLVTDVAMLIIPFPILLKLNIATSEKIGLILTFMAASLGIITCTLRFINFFTTPLFSDPTWYASGGPTIYAMVEPSIYMIASIIPTTRHLYRRIHKKAQFSPLIRFVKSASGASSSPNQSKDANSEEGGELADRPRGVTRNVRIWQGDTFSSQEELTMNDNRDDHDWNQMLRNMKGTMDPTVEPVGPNGRPTDLVPNQVLVRDRTGGAAQ